MKPSFAIIISGLALLLGARITWSQTPECDRLGDERRGLAAGILKSEHPYACCDDTIQHCLKKNKICPLAVRLADNI